MRMTGSAPAMEHPATSQGFRVCVDRVQPVARDVIALRLRDAGGGELPSWRPGAHVDLVLAPGLVRQYSLCGDPADRFTYRLAVLLEPHGRGGSRHVHEHLRAGTTLEVRGPRNHFELVEHPHYSFIAGGIGITPVLPMIHAVEAAGAAWHLTYGGRTRSSMAFVDELLGYGERVELRAQDVHGLLDLAAALGCGAGAGGAVYCCGPEPLIEAVEAACRDLSRSLHVERFAPRPDVLTSAARAIEVVCAQSGLTVTVDPQTSILNALTQAGVATQSSCAEGTCGTCETRVLDGIPEHRDSVLSDEERASGETMMICVSRCRGPRLVLDI
ncbi:MAG: ferredoxin [Solirubrobacterales bacterium]|nr:ferredoxin [Solirubrobacterales bacterium]